MTWLGILLWVGLSAILLGAYFWSTITLQQQKKAWSDFAKRHGLTYTPGRFMDGPVINGNMGDYEVTLASVERDAQDIKARRWVSIIEIGLNRALVGEGAMGTRDMLGFMRTLDKLRPYTPETKEWDEKNHFFTNNPVLADTFWTDDRMRRLNAILSVKNADVLLFHDDAATVVRVETPDPVLKADKAEKVISFVRKQLEALRVDKDTRTAILKEAASRGAKTENVAEAVVPTQPAEPEVISQKDNKETDPNSKST